jgi:hypothetical protein
MPKIGRRIFSKKSTTNTVTILRELRALPDQSALLTGDTELEVEVADVERQAEPAEMMDNQRGEDDEQDRHEDPKQPPE